MPKKKENFITSTCKKKKPLTEGDIKGEIKGVKSNVKPIKPPPVPKPKGDDNIEQEKDLGGRPPMYSDPVELNAKVDEYFDTGCRQVTLGVDKEGNVIKIKRYTITGLSLFLGFSSKQSLYEYGKKPGFIDSIKKARLRVEEMYEEMLASKFTTGAIFALKNMEWKDKTEVDVKADLIEKISVTIENE